MNLKLLDDGNYQLVTELYYFSTRYKKTIVAEPGIYDGATGASDIMSESWVIHDQICNKPFFQDGTPITAWQAATILSDILKSEGRWFRARTWRYSTFAFGCVKTRKNGWW